MKAVVHRINTSLIALLLLMIPLATQIPQAQRLPAIAESSYNNEQIGVRLQLGDSWHLSTDSENALEPFKPLFREGKPADESPLFLGLHENQQLFSRLLVERLDMDLENYVSLVSRAIQQEGSILLSAKAVPERKTVEIEYAQESVGLQFRERISSLPSGYILRMAFWTYIPLAESFRQEIDAGFGAVELHQSVADADTRQWQTSWRDLEALLPPENIAGLTIASLPDPQSEPLVCSDSSQSFLWQAQGKSGNTVHLFGSIHLGKPQFYPLHEIIELAYQNSDHLVLEVNAFSEEFASASVDLQASGVLENNQTLSDVLSDSGYAELETFFIDMGVPIQGFERFQPWFLNLILANIQATAMGYLPDFGVENYFVQQKPAEMDILELETLEDQIAVLQSFNNESFLRYTLLDFEGGKEQLEALIGAWQCGDKNAMQELMFADIDHDIVTPDQMAEYEQALFFDRNAKMAEKVSFFLDDSEDDFFIVVGSGHLIGDDSVVELLQDKGYEVSPVLLN